MTESGFIEREIERLESQETALLEQLAETRGELKFARKMKAQMQGVVLTPSGAMAVVAVGSTHHGTNASKRENYGDNAQRVLRFLASDKEDHTPLQIKVATDLTSDQVRTCLGSQLHNGSVVVSRIDGNLKWYRITDKGLSKLK